MGYRPEYFRKMCLGEVQAASPSGMARLGMILARKEARTTSFIWSKLGHTLGYCKTRIYFPVFAFDLSGCAAFAARVFAVRFLPKPIE